MIKRAIIKLISSLGYELRKSEKKIQKDPLEEMRKAVIRIKNIGIAPEYIVDIGAAKGSWTNMSLDIFPDANYILLEPLREQIETIPKDISLKKKVKIIEGVAGAKDGTIKFSITDDLDGSGIYGKGENQRDVKIYSVDSLLESDIESVMLKLDTHGFEIPIFEGAKETLKRTDVIVVEVYGFNVSPTGKLFHEISNYLNEKGFRLFDIVDIMRRPKDQVFWQADAIYLRAENKVFFDNNYK